MPKTLAEPGRPVKTTTVEEVLTESPSESIDLEEKRPPWQEELAAIKPDEWPEFTCYLYRVEPKYKRGYLDCFSNAITEADIKQRWGGGKFSLSVKRNGKNFRWVPEIPIAGEPKLDEDEKKLQGGAVPNPSGGTDMAQVIDLLREVIAQRGEIRTPEQGGAIDHVTKMLTDANAASLRMVTDQIPKQSSLTELITALKTMRELDRPEPRDGGSLRETLTLLKELGVIRAPGSDGDGGGRRSHLEELKELMTFAKETFGAGGAAGASGAPDWKTAIVEKLPDVLGKAVEGLDKYFNIVRVNADVQKARIDAVDRQRAAALAANGGAPSASRPFVVPAAPGSINGTESEPNTAVQVEPLPFAAPGAQRIAVAPPSAEFVKLKLVEMLAREDDPQYTADFLADLDPGFIKALQSIEEKQLLELIHTDPILMQAEAYPNFAEFVHAFYVAVTEADNEEEPAEAPGETEKKPVQ